MDPLRSLLSIRPDQSDRTQLGGADAVIVDLEGQSQHLDAIQGTEQPLYIKVDPDGIDRLQPKGLAIDGILLARVRNPGQLQAVESFIVELESVAGRPTGSIDLVPLMETPDSIANAADICANSLRVKRLAFGGGDYCRALRLRRTRAERELDIPRKTLVEASIGLGLEAPIDTPFPYADDLEQLGRIAERSLALGYQGKICIHPGQVPVVNRIFG